MKWILILVYAWASSATSLAVEFDDYEACMSARSKIEKTVPVKYLDCVPKGQGR